MRPTAASPRQRGARGAPALPGTGSMTGASAFGRPQAAGKFLSVDGAKLWVKGVTYGTFRPDSTGAEFHDRAQVSRDFAAMAAAGINSVRTYTPPPMWFLDCAAEHGLRVLVGLPWEQHVTFLDDRARARSIVQRVGRFVEMCSGHPAVLGYAVGNEIPAPIVRWHGRKRVERFIERLYWAAKDMDPDGLVTYINYPSTEYLELPFLDLCAFNVYLETSEQLTSYLARLQNLAGDRPLLLAEVGLDSRRNGLAEQADSLRWQLSDAFAAGCAGTFVFAWTDEWHRGGYDIEDWDFGLTDRERRPKPALRAVQTAYASAPFVDRTWPRVSVVVCSYNGAKTIGRTCEALLELDYPDVEVIVVDDGSTDETAAIAGEYSVRVIRTENQGLSAARNTGAEAATGDYVAYLDDDAWPDVHWLKYLVHTFEQGEFAAVGGPNVPPRDESTVARCVACSPGGPIHILFDDVRAEHLPGCNLAVRRSVLLGLGGFDPVFRIAGDDVDLCWRLQENELEIGFSPAAMVWHRRRDSIRGYLRQQRGYGRAEALLERKWPEKYNAGGHPTWAGRIYGPGGSLRIGRPSRVYYGRWGQGLFQGLYQPTPDRASALLLTPEWWLVLGALGALSVLAVAWVPLVVAAYIFALALGLTLSEAAVSQRRSWIGERPSRVARLVTVGLHLTQPLARLEGRIACGLRPWWRRGIAGMAIPVPQQAVTWSEEWRSAEDSLAQIERVLLACGIAPVRGGDFDRWDLDVRGGLLGGVRIRHAVEEHGAGRQLTRFKVFPRVSKLAIALPVLLLGPALLASLAGAWIAVIPLALLGVAVILLAVREASVAAALSLAVISFPEEGDIASELVERIRLATEAAADVPGVAA
jgi:O-antigen biosynthesis protein